MKAIEVKLTVTPKAESMGAYGLVSAVMPYVELLKAVKVPEGVSVSVTVEEPRWRKAKAATTQEKTK